MILKVIIAEWNHTRSNIISVESLMLKPIRIGSIKQVYSIYPLIRQDILGGAFPLASADNQDPDH